MYSEDDLLPISGLQHVRFCERRWSLGHLEQQWESFAADVVGQVAGAHRRRTASWRGRNRYSLRMSNLQSWNQRLAAVLLSYTPSLVFLWTGCRLWAVFGMTRDR